MRLVPTAKRSHHTCVGCRLNRSSVRASCVLRQPKQIFIRESSMRSKLMLSFAASAAVVLFQPTSQTVWAQGQAALTGTVSSEAEGNMEGVVVTAKKARLDRRGQRDHRRAGPLRVPGEPPGPGRIYAQHPRGRLRHRRPDQGEGGAREDRHGRHQAQEDQESRQPAHQRRVDDEHPRHRRPEGDAAQLPGLSHPGAHHALDP